MKPVICSQLRMERGNRHDSLPGTDDPLRSPHLDGAEDLDADTDTLDRRRADEDRVQWSAEAVELEIALEGVHLAAERVSPHRDVDGCEGTLVCSTVEHLARQQDHARTGAKSRHPGREALGEWLAKARGVNQHHQRRRLTAGEDERIHVLEICRQANLRSIDSETVERREVLGHVTLER